jgi:acetyl-CoA carboxylase carboxyl transferase subunit alpha
MDIQFDFEKPIVTLEKKLKDLEELSGKGNLDLSQEISGLKQRLSTLIDETYAQLTPWQKVLLCRHPNRPHTLDFIEALFPDFMELHGDRTHGEDPALIGGIAHWPSEDPAQRFPILILGHQKGRNTKQKVHRNFGMSRPEGYRKAIRLAELANRSKMPILTFIDTPGAYPSIEAEERGQATAIAECIQTFFEISVPVFSLVIGEGGSGGALAIGIANQVMMLEYSTYSVISPEGCASILWSDARLAEKASEKLKLSPPDLLKMGVIDGIIPEPKGGAHRNWDETFELVQKRLEKDFLPMLQAAPAKKDHRKTRLLKFQKLGLESFE